MKRIPSTQALRALDSFTRHGSVWKAADELNLTRSAVSHQLRLLERDLGFQLLNRIGTRIELAVNIGGKIEIFTIWRRCHQMPSKPRFINNSRIISRARNSLFLTVPSGRPVMSLISS